MVGGRGVIESGRGSKFRENGRWSLKLVGEIWEMLGSSKVVGGSTKYTSRHILRFILSTLIFLC